MLSSYNVFIVRMFELKLIREYVDDHRLDGEPILPAWHTIPSARHSHWFSWILLK